jgi:hypothetical protein
VSRTKALKLVLAEVFELEARLSGEHFGRFGDHDPPRRRQVGDPGSPEDG